MNRHLRTLRENFRCAEVLSKRGSRVIVRWREAESETPIVIKMWSRSDLWGRLRRLLRISAAEREWRNLSRLDKFGVPVPLPLGFCRVAPNIDGYTDALFMEDLGECKTATEYLKQLIREGKEKQVLEFEGALIDITRRILYAGMLDDDHGTLNIVVQPSGRPVRLDLEIARCVYRPTLFPEQYGRMLGRLVGLHAFAVQPDVDRTRRFAERLGKQLDPPLAVLEHASRKVQELLAQQRQHVGIDTRLVLPWG